MMGVCSGIVAALVEVGPDLRPAICTPTGSTLSQWQAVVVKYLRDHPEQLHYSFVSLARVALSAAWPCGQKGN